jgi:DNA-binding NtrC family response regulator
MPRVSSVPISDRFNHLPQVSSGPVVLLVADDPATSFAAQRALRAAGYETKLVRLGLKTADDLRGGRGLRQSSVELVVLDASRQPRAAIASLEALRTADSTLPVILIADADVSVAEEASRLGAEEVLASPLDVLRLRSAAETLAPLLRDVDVAVEARGYSFH